MDIKHRIYKHIGRKIAEARKQKHMIQGDLAQAVYLTRTSITNIEAGGQKIQLYTLYEIAIILDKPIDFFLPRIEQLDISLENLLDEAKVLNRQGEFVELSEGDKIAIKNLLTQ